MGAMHVVVIGGGVAGLTAAYELTRAGARVTLFESAGRLGGLASSFTAEEGLELERYYHFICRPDRPYFEALRQLGMGDRLRWVTTEMGLFHKGRLHTLGDPISLLTFPHLRLSDKVRFAWATLRAKLGPGDGRALANVAAQPWLVAGYGPRTYDMLFEPLLRLKFREHAGLVSAAWMWARLHRLSRSRTLLQKERIGYLVGGTQTFVAALEKAVREQGGKIRLRTAVEQVAIEGGRVVGVRAQGEFEPCDQVLSTVPIPTVLALLPRLDGPYFENLRSLAYIDVLVLVLRLRQRFSKYFWLNISDPSVDLAGIIEYTNLNPCPGLGGDAILYIPQYLPAGHPLWQLADDELLALYCRHLARLRPEFDLRWVRQFWVFRDRYAQPICQVGFPPHIPAVQTPIANLYITDSYQLHPDERTVANSIMLGRNAARSVLRGSAAR